MLMETLENHFNAEFNGDIIDYVMDAGDTQITAHTKIVYCNYVSYALTYSCADDTVGNIIFDLTFANTA